MRVYYVERWNKLTDLDENGKIIEGAKPLLYGQDLDRTPYTCEEEAQRRANQLTRAFGRRFLYGVYSEAVEENSSRGGGE